MAAQAGSAFVDFHADLSSLQKQVAAGVAPLTSRFGKLGTAATVGLGAIAVGGVAAGKALYDVGKSFDDAYDQIRTSTGATGKELGKLKKDFGEVVKDVPADFDTAGKAISGIAQRMDLTGRPLRRLSKQLLELSRITETDINENVEATTRLFGDWSVKTKNQGKTLDKLFRVTQETGIGLGDLSRLMVQFGSPLRQLGIDFDTAAAMFARFEKEGVNIQTLMPGLRFGLKTLSGATPEVTAELEKLGVSLKDPSKALADIFELIEDAPTDLKANALAFKVFGVRAGPDMAAAIREGRFELDELMQTMKKGDETVLSAGRKTRDFAEEWQLFTNRLKVAVEPAAKKVFQTLNDGMKTLNKLMKGSTEGASQAMNIGSWENAWETIGQGTAEAIRFQINAAEDAGHAISRGQVRGWVKAGEISKESADLILEQLHFIKHGANTQLRHWLKPFIHDTKTSVKDLEQAWEPFEDALGITFDRGGKKARDAHRKHAKGAADDANKYGKGLWGNWDGWLKDVVGSGKQKGSQFDKALSGSYRNMQKASGKAMDDLMAETNDLLESLGVDPVGFKAKKGKTRGGAGGQPGSNSGAARGGLFQFGSPGDVGHDSIAARIGGQDVRVAPGEVGAVFNRHQLPILNARLSDLGGLPGFFQRFDKPHYMAQGGVVPGYASGGLQPGISRLVEWADQELGLSVSSGLRPGDSGSFHGSGEAADFTPPSMKATVSIFKSWKNQLEELFYDPWGGWDSGQQIGAIGGHMDHIHAAILGTGGGGALGDFAAAAAPELARTILQGPPGALTSMGQGAIDSVQKAAQAYLDKHAGSGGASTANGPLKQMGRDLVLQMWNAGQWPPFDDLVMRESGWDPEAVNASSGAAGLAQALPPSKYPPGAWPYQGVDSARLQLEWMVGYIKDRYGSPSSAISFHDANNWYSQGGLVGGMAKGGLIGSILKKVHKGKPIKGLVEKLKKLGLDNQLQNKLDGLGTDATLFEELADSAGSLTTENSETGEITYGMAEGPGGWQDEAQWLTQALDKLWKLRDVLVHANDEMQKARAQIAAMLEAARTRMDDLKEKRERLQGRLNEITGGGKGAKDAREALREQIQGVEEERTHIRDKVMGSLKLQDDKLKPQADAITGSDGLEGIQGAGASMDIIEGDTTWDQILGRFRGRLFDVSLRLRDLNAPKEPVSGTGADDPSADLLAQLLSDWQKRYVVSQAQYPVFKDFAGAFAKGGTIRDPWALVGERGPELAQLPVGTHVNSNPESQSMLSPTVNVYVDPFSLETKVETIIDGHLTRTVSKARRRVSV